jgi:sirohydrochlorin cobaltochelatase
MVEIRVTAGCQPGWVSSESVSLGRRMALVEGIPIGTGRRPPRGPARAEEGLLLIGHGSRCVRSEMEMHSLADLVSAVLPSVAIEVGFLEMTEPPAATVIDRLVERGCEGISVLPLVLLGAGHAKSDVPAVILDGRQRHPGVQIHFGSPLGVSRLPVELLGKGIVAAGGAGLPLLMVARGTSDPDANADAYKAARLLAEWTGAPFVHVGFSGVTWPSVLQAADTFAGLGFPRLAVVWWYLCHGRLIEQGRLELARFETRTGVEILDAGHIGPHPGLVPLIVERHHEASHGHPVVNCDTCAYRAPWPGREERVGQALGVGHSHLAAEHRRHRH